MKNDAQDNESNGDQDHKTNNDQPHKAGHNDAGNRRRLRPNRPGERPRDTALRYYLIFGQARRAHALLVQYSLGLLPIQRKHALPLNNPVQLAGAGTSVSDICLLVLLRIVQRATHFR